MKGDTKSLDHGPNRIVQGYRAPQVSRLIQGYMRIIWVVQIISEGRRRGLQGSLQEVIGVCKV